MSSPTTRSYLASFFDSDFEAAFADENVARFVAAGVFGHEPQFLQHLWRARGVLPGDVLETLLSPSHIAGLFAAVPPVASSPELAARGDREVLLRRIFADSKSCSDHTRARELLAGALAEPPLIDLAVDVLMAQRSFIVAKQVTSHDRFPDIAARLVDAVFASPSPFPVDVPIPLEVVRAATLVAEANPELMLHLEAHPQFVSTLVSYPNLVTGDLVAACAAGVAVVDLVVAAAVESSSPSSAALAPLLDSNDAEIAAATRFALPFQDVEAVTGRSRVKRELLELIAGRLDGNPAATSTLWGLAAEWSGTCAELVDAALSVVAAAPSPTPAG